MNTSKVFANSEDNSNYIVQLTKKIMKTAMIRIKNKKKNKNQYIINYVLESTSLIGTAEASFTLSEVSFIRFNKKRTTKKRKRQLILKNIHL